jgi:hypothetical protein
VNFNEKTLASMKKISGILGLCMPWLVAALGTRADEALNCALAEDRLSPWPLELDG